ncbi:histidine kinase [Amycolatopsis sp. NBRC 101858]|uniref:sensor histidine kinase n=1 Tax=Amycolatopsis sp. NBRC 101858 TaxID=3032200 RepID=UPI0024A552A1|nr:sensor histidine kinase [Amycolatopsis sp. NBRC 101858]GLY44330.1 histidine kinase [Amycolatopsis sp. NBRC 101858]
MTTRLRECWSAARYLLVGAGTSLLSIFALVGLLAVLLLCPFGVGIPSLAPAIKLARRPVGIDRRRAARRLGEAIPEPYRDGSPLKDPATRRDLAWLAIHAATGMLLGAVAIGLPLGAVQQFVTAFVWPAVPGGLEGSLGIVVTSWPTAALCFVSGIAMAAAALVYPRVARWQARTAKRLLEPGPDAVLADRVAELTATRAAALEAHGAELRRIERDLHDGTQARIAAVVLQLGIAGQLYDRDPATVRDLLVKAQDTATDALAELRTVVRSIYPPLLSERGLAGAVRALAERTPVPAAVTVEYETGRPAAVEAAAYFVVAEALANITKHADASTVDIKLGGTASLLTLEIRDDGRGGADEQRGSGLAGIRRRAEAFDGTLTLTSPPGGPTVLRVELPCGS